MPLRGIPQIDQRAPWPTLAISSAERQHVAAPVAPAAGGTPRRTGAPAPGRAWAQPQVQPQPQAQVQPQPKAQPRPPVQAPKRGWVAAIPKGALLGAGLFALYYGFYPHRAFWLSQWHWAYLLGAMALATILIRFDRMLIVLVGVGFWFSRTSLIQTPQIFGIWVAGGIVARLLFEALP